MRSAAWASMFITDTPICTRVRTISAKNASLLASTPKAAAPATAISPKSPRSSVTSIAACTPLRSISRSTAPRSSIGPTSMAARPEMRSVCAPTVTWDGRPLLSKKVPVTGSRPRTCLLWLVVLICSRNWPDTLNTLPPSMMVEFGLLPPTSKAPYSPVLPPSITKPSVPVTPSGSSTGRSSTAVAPSSRMTAPLTSATITAKSPCSASAPSNRSSVPWPVNAAYMPVHDGSFPGG